MLSDPRGPHCDGLRVCFMHACTLLAIIDPFKPCPGTVDGINFANLRRWMNCRNSWSVRSSRPHACKVESWQGATAWPGWGRFERNKFRKSSYRNVRQLCTWGRGVMPLLDRSLVSRLAHGGSVLPEHHLQRFAKFIPSPVWNS